MKSLFHIFRTKSTVSFHSAFDRDTSIAIPTMLATMLKNKGYRMDSCLFSVKRVCYNKNVAQRTCSDPNRSGRWSVQDFYEEIRWGIFR